MTTSTLPHGDVGRIVNSFVGVSHPDAIEWQRDFRNNLYANSAKNKNMELLLESIKGQVYLACLKEIDQKYIHAFRLPDYRRIIPLTDNLPEEQQPLVGKNILPPEWYPVRSLHKLRRAFNLGPVGKCGLTNVSRHLPEGCTHLANRSCWAMRPL